MNLECLKELPEELRKLVVGAMEQKAVFAKIGGHVYAMVPTTGPLQDGKHQEAYWVYRLEENAPEYFVTMNGCSCPAYQHTGSMCKHMRAVKYGSEWEVRS